MYQTATKIAILPQKGRYDYDVIVKILGEFSPVRSRCARFNGAAWAKLPGARGLRHPVARRQQCDSLVRCPAVSDQVRPCICA